MSEKQSKLPMNLKVYCFIMVLSSVQSDILFVGTVNNDFNIFIQNLILKHFNSSRFIGIFHDNKGMHDINLHKLLESLRVPVKLHDLIVPEVQCNCTECWIPKKAVRLTDANVIIIENSKDLRSMLKVAASIPFFSARTNVLIIFTGIVSGTEPWVRKVFSELWKMYILNVGLVFYNGRVNLLTYIPWTSPHKIQNLTDQGISANIFYNKLKNLRKYPIKILRNINDMKLIVVNKTNSTTYLGLNGMTMSTILERHNATSNIITLNSAIFSSPCRFIHYNYTIQGFFGADADDQNIDFCSFSLQLPTSSKRPSELEVIYHDIDVYFSSRPLRFDMDYRVDTSTVQQRDSYCILIPAAHKLPQSIHFLLPIQEYMWLAIVLNFIIHSIIYFGIQNLDESNKKSFFHTCLTLYRVQMNSVAPEQKKLRALEKAYLLCWVSYSFVISAAYQSVLISFITVPLYGRPINRIQDLKKMDITIFAARDILADMPNAIDSETSTILREKIAVDLWTGERKYDVKNGYLISESEAHYVLSRKDFIDKDGRPLFHLMNECVMPLFTSYLMPRGSPLLKITNEFMFRKAESGLDQIWQADAERYLNGHIVTQNEYNEERIRLTTAHLEGAFYIFCIGHIAATTAFLFELYWKRIRRFICITKTRISNSQR